MLLTCQIRVKLHILLLRGLQPEFMLKYNTKELIKFDMSETNDLDDDLESTYDKKVLDLLNP